MFIELVRSADLNFKSQMNVNCLWTLMHWIRKIHKLICPRFQSELENLIRLKTQKKKKSKIKLSAPSVEIIKISNVEKLISFYRVKNWCRFAGDKKRQKHFKRRLSHIQFDANFHLWSLQLLRHILDLFIGRFEYFFGRGNCRFFRNCGLPLIQSQLGGFRST
jgi:hypothetical protein